MAAAFTICVPVVDDLSGCGQTQACGLRILSPPLLTQTIIAAYGER